jgi:F-type H+-transporting ATPase subunit delta
MSDVIIARRYARALYDLAAERQQVKETEQELTAVNALVMENQDLKRFLSDQKLGSTRKKEVLQALLADRVSLSTLHFLFLVVDKKRERLLELIGHEFHSLINQAANVLEGEVASAVTLSPEEIAGLEKALERMIKQKVRLNNRVVPELLGGVRVRLGDRVIDSSLRWRLAALKQKLLDADLSQIGVS